MKNNIDRDLRARIDTFVAELTDLVRQAALSSLHNALGAPSSAPAASAARAIVPRRRGRPAKRDAAGMQQAADSLLAYIKANEGMRIDQIAKALGMQTKELTGPAKMLLDAKAIKRKGQRRGTTYYAK